MVMMTPTGKQKDINAESDNAMKSEDESK